MTLCMPQWVFRKSTQPLQEIFSHYNSFIKHSFAMIHQVSFTPASFARISK
jgi:hypothetical protein